MQVEILPDFRLKRYVVPPQIGAEGTRPGLLVGIARNADADRKDVVRRHFRVLQGLHDAAGHIPDDVLVGALCLRFAEGLRQDFPLSVHDAGFDIGASQINANVIHGISSPDLFCHIGSIILAEQVAQPAVQLLGGGIAHPLETQVPGGHLDDDGQVPARPDRQNDFR